MKLTIYINLDNAAFFMPTSDDRDYHEPARILRKLAGAIENGEASGNLRDHNGNKVGEFDTTG